MDRKLHFVGVGLLAAAHWLIVVDAARQSTPTYDEVAHLPAGLSYLQNGAFKMYRLSPPLGRVVPALAASGAGMKLDYEGTWRLHDPPSHWSFAYAAIAANAENAASMLRYLAAFDRGRLMMATWSALTIPLLFAWANWRVGLGPAWLAAALWAFCPNVIAHASLVTTDLPATSMAVAACFAFDRWLASSKWQSGLLAGIALGAAQLTKFSLLWLYPAFVAWWIANEFRAGRPRRWQRCLQLLAIFFSSVATIDAGYLFHGVGTALGRFPFACNLLTRPRLPTDGPMDRSWNVGRNDRLKSRVNRMRGTIAGTLPCPLPYDYVAGFDEQVFEAEFGTAGYLNGVWTDAVANGPSPIWRHYFLYAMAVKTPLGTGVLVCLAAISIGRLPGPVRRSTLVWVLLAVVPVAAASFGTLSYLGVRYVLPAYPFGFLVASGAVFSPVSKLRGTVVVGAVAMNILSLARIHPHELGYFNEAVGGPTQGRFHLIDSNIDWGQDLGNLSRWIARHPEWKNVRLAYAGSIPPEFVGLPHRPAPRDIRAIPDQMLFPWEHRGDPTTYGPQPGKYAVSVNFERGMAFQTPAPLSRPGPGGTMIRLTRQKDDPVILRVPRNAYGYFQNFTPSIDAAIGYSVLLYDLQRDDVNAVRRKMSLAPLSE